jgi:hypothetical protein
MYSMSNSNSKKTGAQPQQGTYGWHKVYNHHQVCLVAPTYYSWMIATRVAWKLPNDIFIDGNLSTPKFDPSANKARVDNFF